MEHWRTEIANWLRSILKSFDLWPPVGEFQDERINESSLPAIFWMCRIWWQAHVWFQLRMRYFGSMIWCEIQLGHVDGWANVVAARRMCGRGKEAWTTVTHHNHIKSLHGSIIKHFYCADTREACWAQRLTLIIIILDDSRTMNTP